MSIGYSYLLLRVRFKAQQFYDWLLGYIANVAFMDRLRDVQRRIENQIVTNCQEDKDKYEDKGGFEELGDLASLRNEHDQVLD
ncbi:hypothetical protein BGZ88_000265 [Linnemannia elongata]|nr:hypothetical protein BGZ88_000265 [Linnemannia elongata]